MGAYEVVSSLFLLATLVVLIVYTAKTATIARAAVDQVEATQKPCLLPEIPPIGDWAPGAADEPLTSDPDWQNVTLGPNLRNVGTGPALKVAFAGADDDPYRRQALSVHLTGRGY